MESSGLRPVNKNPLKNAWYSTHDQWGRPRGSNQPYFDRYNNPGESIELGRPTEVAIDVGPDDSSVFSETSFTENTPLLSAPVETIATAGSATSAATGTAGSLGTATAVGLTTLGGAGTAATAYGIYKATQGQGGADEKGGLNLPGHKYIGPLNKNDRGAAVDEDDIIAEEHDKAYQSAKTKQDVSVADDKAFNDFLTDWIENGNWHSLIGAIGLKGKTYVEKLTGQLYPNITGTSIRVTTLG